MSELHVRTYIGTLLAFAAALAASWAYWYTVPLEPRFVIGTLVLAGLILLGEAFPIRVSGETTIGAWDIGLVVAIAAVGPAWAAAAALPAALFTGRGDWLRTGFEV